MFNWDLDEVELTLYKFVFVYFPTKFIVVEICHYMPLLCPLYFLKDIVYWGLIGKHKIQPVKVYNSKILVYLQGWAAIIAI